MTVSEERLLPLGSELQLWTLSDIEQDLGCKKAVGKDSQAHAHTCVRVCRIAQSGR